MTTLERVTEDASVDDGLRVQVIAAGLVEVFNGSHCPDLAAGVENVMAAWQPAQAEVALVGFYARIAESLQT
jgi:hypothetical protein